MNNFTSNCVSVMKSIVNKEDLPLTSDIMQSIYKEYTKQNMIECIRYINKEYTKLDFSINEEYIKTYQRLKNILKNIEDIKNIYQFSEKVVIDKMSFFTICNKQHYSKLYYTINGEGILCSRNKIMDFTWLNSQYALWDSHEENDVVIALDRSNNIYKFICKDGKYNLIESYTLMHENLIKGVNYKTFYGTIKSI